MPPAQPPFGPRQPREENTAALDPALSVLGAFFRALLEHYCGPAWKSIAPNEPIVRVLSVGHDPEDIDFHDGMVPLLALWRDHDGAPARLDDSSAQQSSLVNVLWILPPADEQKLAARSPFFNLFTKAMLIAFQNERDPSWVREEDAADPAARTYGSWAFGLAGLDGWTYGGTKRVPVQVPTGGETRPFPAYLATWTILESSENDPTAFGSTIAGVRVGTEPTEIRIDLTDRAPTEQDPEVLTRLSAVAAPPPEDT